MDLWQLKIFCSVVEQKSFSKAGKEIHLSQPTISSHIRDLETHFNCRLIDRLGKEAVPTGAGKLLYNHARKILALRDSAETAMAEYQGLIKGKIKIGGSTIPGSYILPQFIGQFVSLNPEVKITLIINDTLKIIEEIISGDLEIGLVGAEINDRRIIQTPLIQDNMYIIVPKDHKWFSRNEIKPEELLTEPFIIREEGSGTRRSLNKKLEKSNISLEDFNITAELGSTSSVIQGIKSGLGISVLSSIAVSEDLKTKNLKALRIKGVDLSRQFYLTYHKDRTPSPLMNSFKNFLESGKKF